MAEMPRRNYPRYLELRDTEPVPAYWKRIAVPNFNAWAHPVLGLRLLESVDIQRDNRNWLHVSVSRASRLPSWDDMKLARQDFIGERRECYSVFPPIDRWVNDHPYTLHLWACLDAIAGCVLPDFRTDGGSI